MGTITDRWSVGQAILVRPDGHPPVIGWLICLTAKVKHSYLFNG